jgi:hypothetical protein
VTPQPIARGPGPQGVRIALAVLAVGYMVALYKPDILPQPGKFFVDATGLFPYADKVAQEYRLQGWSCGRKRWEWLDPRPYFPLRGDDKESRFQRLAHFYHYNRTVMWALDDFIVGHHPDFDDGIDGPIGGIQLLDITRPIPPVGTEIERYEYKPLEPVPRELEKLNYKTVRDCPATEEADKKCEPARTLKARCQ